MLAIIQHIKNEIFFRRAKKPIVTELRLRLHSMEYPSPIDVFDTAFNIGSSILDGSLKEKNAWHLKNQQILLDVENSIMDLVKSRLDMDNPSVEDVAFGTMIICRELAKKYETKV